MENGKKLRWFRECKQKTLHYLIENHSEISKWDVRNFRGFGERYPFCEDFYYPEDMCFECPIMLMCYENEGLDYYPEGIHKRDDSKLLSDICFFEDEIKELEDEVNKDEK